MFMPTKHKERKATFKYTNHCFTGMQNRWGKTVQRLKQPETNKDKKNNENSREITTPLKPNPVDHLEPDGQSWPAKLLVVEHICYLSSIYSKQHT